MMEFGSKFQIDFRLVSELMDYIAEKMVTRLSTCNYIKIHIE